PPGKAIAQSVGLWLACLCLLAQPRIGSCFGLFSASPEPSGFSEIIGSPADHWWWDVNTITYKFDASFDVLFPDASIKNQIRLAFKQWDQAFNTANGANYHYNRANGAQDFVDIRSVTVHEMGHVLGLGHCNQAALANRNYRPAGGGGFVHAMNHDHETLPIGCNQADYNHSVFYD